MVSTWPTRSTASWKYSCLIQPGTLYHLSQASPGIFNPLESLAMYVGAICHDLDHRQAVQQKMTIAPTIKSSKNPQTFCSTPIPWFSFPVWPIVSDRTFTFRGFNNKFMIDISSPLSGMYATSVMENHHFAMAVSILQQVFYSLKLIEIEIFDRSKTTCWATCTLRSTRRWSATWSTASWPPTWLSSSPTRRAWPTLWRRTRSTGSTQTIGKKTNHSSRP